jgi:hypothetical protein
MIMMATGISGCILMIMICGLAASYCAAAAVDDYTTCRALIMSFDLLLLADVIMSCSCGSSVITTIQPIITISSIIIVFTVV